MTKCEQDYIQNKHKMLILYIKPKEVRNEENFMFFIGNNNVGTIYRM